MDEVTEKSISDLPEEQQHPEGPVKPTGRPRWNPTPEDRLKISRMAALGIPHYQIAIVFGIGVKKLRRNCKAELSESAIYANLQVTETLHKMATSGTNTAASIFWAQTRCGFRPGLPALSDTGAPTKTPPPPPAPAVTPASPAPAPPDCIVFKNSKGERIG